MSESDNKPKNVNALARVLVKQWEDKRWRPYLELLGLHDAEASERMNRILVLHLLLDRALTAILATKLVDRSSATYSYADFAKIEGILTWIDMEQRIELAKASRLISDPCASNMKTLNTLRNKLAHYTPEKGWEVSYVQELSSANAFDQCTNKGLAALDEALRTMTERMLQSEYRPDSDNEVANDPRSYL